MSEVYNHFEFCRVNNSILPLIIVEIEMMDVIVYDVYHFL